MKKESKVGAAEEERWIRPTLMVLIVSKATVKMKASPEPTPRCPLDLGPIPDLCSFDPPTFSPTALQMRIDFPARCGVETWVKACQ